MRRTGATIPDAPRKAPARTSAAEFVPPRPTLPKLRAAAAHCRGCELWRNATRTVFGEGRSTARVMIVGEQPGDQEDREGRPFVGPSGRLLDAALEEAGIERELVYVTNAVKHFKWERGEKSTRRIHKKPNDGEIRACRPWLDAELAIVQPRVIVCLGATAAQSLLGKSFRVTKDRGRPLPSEVAPAIFATVHPSSVLRARTDAERAKARADFVADMKAVARYLTREKSPTLEAERPLARAVEPEASRRARGSSRRPAGRREPEHRRTR